ncbi:hypothetical protein AB204_16320 [Xenorhabdus khoisanae]|uniref:Uncharacterized protein n=1 Tax=Xenorhabdus khoisanae TaxID=880157 RepID=A0A0J5FP59_9GAMM|nr:hypothetical protein [Xenorhabdus khoisanae]KMJ44066.1 hypothetical protein AB204_16320 [Xenorhabdus khoisanae]
MIYGLKIINPHDETSFIFNANTAPASLIWVDKVNFRTPGAQLDRFGNGTWTCPVKIPVGYKSMVACGSMTELDFYYDDDNSWGSSMRLNGGMESCNYIQSGDVVSISNMSLADWERKPINNTVKVIAYPQYNQTGTVGLNIEGNSNFNVDIPPSGFSYVSHKAVLRVDGEVDFSKISPQLNVHNCLAFFHTDNPYAMIVPWEDRYICKDRRNGRQMSAVFRIVIFSDVDSSMRFANDHYGLQLRNSRGNITFSSGVGVLTRPKEVYLNSYKQNDRISIPDITYPMYIPSSVGDHFWVDVRLGKTEYIYLSNYDAKSIGFGVSSTYSRYGHLGSRAYGWDYTYITKKPVLIIDASDYFNF